MGRYPVSLKIDGTYLRHLLKHREVNLTERAEKYGVSKQAMNNWFATGRIPPRALYELSICANISAEEMDEIIISARDESQDPPKRRWQITVEEM